MPIYAYMCEKCSKEIEIIRKFSEMNDPIKCDDCGQLIVKPKVSKNTFKLIGKFS